MIALLYSIEQEKTYSIKQNNMFKGKCVNAISISTDKN